MKLFVIAATALMVASQAFAGSYEQRCQVQDVPYQATVNATPGQVVGGAVIGGVVGNVVTKDTAGTAAGALIGGAVANEANKKTVTRYKRENVCKTVYVPARITDEQRLRRVVKRLDDGKPVKKESIMDVQYTVGVPHDGIWGPQSQRAARKYLANLKPNAPMYALEVNGVVITRSADVTKIDQMKKSLLKAGVDSQVIVKMQ